MKCPKPVHVPPKRLQGRDWHGWALKLVDKPGEPLCFFAEAFKPEKPPERGMTWVKVKFVEVEE